MNTRRECLLALGVVLVAAPFESFAQQKEKIWRVGFLASQRRDLKPDYELVPRRLSEFGYAEGKNLVIEWRSAAGAYERLPALAAELVKLKVDLIVTDGTPGIIAAQEATTTIPIVFIGGADLVASGLVKSLARPGGNTTGVSLLMSDTVGKQLELLISMLPRLSRIGLLLNPANQAHPSLLKGFRAAAEAIKVQLVPVEARTPREIEDAISQVASERVDALIWIVDSFLNQQQRQIADLSLKHGLPSMSGYPRYAESGGLMCYGPNLPDLWRRAADYVDKILKGANPGDLPVEQPKRLELVVNRGTAKALGLTIPPELLLLADKVIE